MAVRLIMSPEHTTVFPVIDATGKVCRLMVCVVVSEQDPAVAISVYVVLLVGAELIVLVVIPVVLHV